MGLSHSETSGSKLVWQLTGFFRGLLRPSSPACPKASTSCPESLIAFFHLSSLSFVSFWSVPHSPGVRFYSASRTKNKKLKVYDQVLLPVPSHSFRIDRFFCRSLCFSHIICSFVYVYPTYLICVHWFVFLKTMTFVILENHVVLPS